MQIYEFTFLLTYLLTYLPVYCNCINVQDECISRLTKAYAARVGTATES